MTNGLAVSVLDLVGMHSGEPAGSAIARSVDLARHAERLGYTRFWLAEHHSIEGLACSATPVLIGHIAASTKAIRVGSGGVMLPNHAPLVVAEQFGTLKRCFPDESIWVWDELPDPMSKLCGRCAGICIRPETNFPNWWKRYVPTSARHGLGKR